MTGTLTQVGQDFTIFWATGTEGAYLYGGGYTSGAQVGLVGTLSYSVDPGTEAYHGAGKREPWGIRSGPLDITVHLENLWIDSGVQGFLMDQAEATGALVSFALLASGSETKIAFSGCKLDSFDGEFDAEGWATETVDLLAMGLAKS